MANGPGPVAREVRQFLGAEKFLEGRPSWVENDSAGEQRIKWPLRIGDAVSPHFITIAAYPQLPVLKFTICLIYDRRCISRLCFCPDYECHPNPPDRFHVLGAYEVCGPHHHSWNDNEHLATAATLPMELPCARSLPPQIRRFEQAFRWFCDEHRILFDPAQVIELPERDRFL